MSLDKNESEVSIGQETVTAIQPGELVVGVLIGFDAENKPLIKSDSLPELDGISVMTTVPLDREMVGRQVALMFANQDITQPIVIGVIRSQLTNLLDIIEVDNSAISDEQVFADNSIRKSESAGEADPSAVTVDGKTVTISGEEQVVLKCGDSSITLTKSGKILIRGKYLLNRSTGVNRIMGGSVQVN